jgi:DNA-binding response OmpR family regulator
MEIAMPRIRVLLVEDDAVVRAILAETLNDAGYAVDVAESGDVAVRMLDQDGYCALVTDLNMPGKLSGIDIAGMAQAGQPNLPVVFVTGRPDLLDRMRTVKGPAAVLPKPFPLDQLVQTVSTLLSRSRQANI